MNPQFHVMKNVLLLCYLLCFLSCTEKRKPKDTKPDHSVVSNQKIAGEKENQVSNSLRIYKGDTLVPVDFFNKDIYWELKYATADNFMGKVLYDTMQVLYVQQNVARKLAKCQELLEEKRPGLHLLVYDGLRPLSVQWEMWNALDTIPVADRIKFVSNPQNGSVHNYGAALDITISDGKKRALDMGANYDDLRKIAYPSLEAQFLASGELTQGQVENRRMLRAILATQGFRNIPTEWWHFNEYSRTVVKQKYQLITEEIR
jgi:D-alanyl-D-alanine dipeptidase